MTVRVTLSGDPERTVTIPITTDQATTAADRDYSLSSADVTFASGETSKDISLTAADDNVDDDGEVVVLGFGTLPPRVLAGGRASATITIRDKSPARSEPSDNTASAGGGGCALAAGADYRTEDPEANPLATITILFLVLLRKNRLTNQPRYRRSP